MNAAEAEGAVVFMQKSHDHDLLDPVLAPYDGYLIQVREPIARVLSNYELELKTSGLKHSTSYQQFWLGLEAYYTVGFTRKWCARQDIRSLVLRYEDLLDNPIGYFSRIFEAFGIPREYFRPEAVLESQGVSSGNKGPFRPRAIELSKYYDPANLASFGKIVEPATSTLGYSSPIPTDVGEPRRQIELVFHTRTCLDKGDFRGALETINECLREPLAHPFLLRIRSSIYSSLGLTREAERDLLATMRREPAHPDAYLHYAKLLRGQMAHASSISEILLSCLEQAGNKALAAASIRAQFPGTEAASRAGNYVTHSITRDEVIAAFKILLGRDPEDERVIASHQNVDSLEALRKILLESEEFALKYKELAHVVGDSARAAGMGRYR
jgi:hypothetical protein